MNKALRWGILGSSKFALEHMLPAMQLARQTKCAALATSRCENAKPFLNVDPDIKIYEGYDLLLQDQSVDAVYIPLPNHLHIEWAKKAIEAGKHVLCEKPIALYAREIEDLIEMRDRSGLVVAEAYMIVHHPQWQHAKSLLQSGIIGDLVQVDGVFSYNNGNDLANIRNIAAAGGGSLPDIGVYTMGSARFLTDEEPQEILNSSIIWENNVDVWASVTAQFPSFKFIAVTSMRMQLRQEMNFHGTDGLIRLTTPFNPQVFGQADVHLYQEENQAKLFSFPRENHYVNQLEAFGLSVKNGIEYPCPLEFSQGTQRMIDMVFEKEKLKS
jgi:predicted dehydrogenase